MRGFSVNFLLKKRKASKMNPKFSIRLVFEYTCTEPYDRCLLLLLQVIQTLSRITCFDQITTLALACVYMENNIFMVL